eukprot:3238052-Pyramimonas_sp.AAC.1
MREGPMKSQPRPRPRCFGGDQSGRQRRAPRAGAGNRDAAAFQQVVDPLLGALGVRRRRDEGADDQAAVEVDLEGD